MSVQIQSQKMLSKYSYTDIHFWPSAIYTVGIFKKKKKVSSHNSKELAF